MIRILILQASMLIGVFSYAQSVDFSKSNFPEDSKGLKKAMYNFDEGDHYYVEGDEIGFNYALPYYLKAFDFNKNNAELNYKIGKCYLYTTYKRKSLSFLESAYSLDMAAGKDLLLILGLSNHLNEKWDLAIKWFNQYEAQLERSKGFLKNDPAILSQVNLCKKKIAECESAKILTAVPVNVKIDNLGGNINTHFPEYYIVINADESEMMFTSRRTGSTGESTEESHDDFMVHYEDVYESKQTSKTSWTKAKSVGSPINTPINDACIAMSPDGHTLITYNDHDHSMGGDLYECKLKGDHWSKPARLPNTINTHYHECSASYSYDGKSLFFVSNNPENNFGDHDIFVSRWDDVKGTWGTAENLGETINTKYSEVSVYAVPDGKTIYFSSKGHNTMGGFDIFKAVYDYDLAKWGEPENVGYPINSADNDVGLVMSANGLHGYISAHHDDAIGQEDIYLLTFPIENQQALTILKGHVFDAKTKEAIHSTINILDLEEHKVIATFESNELTGHYLVSLPAGKNYAIEIEADNYLFHSENFNLPETDGYHEEEIDVYLNKIEIGSKIVLNNIFFDFDKSTLRSTSIDELNILLHFLSQNSTIRVEISGHTDSKGSQEYNQKLSENRAHVVVDWLIEKGISKDRMVYKGYGEMNPIETNDTEIGRQHNRRTELKIIGK